MFYNCYNIEGVGLMAYNEASKNATMKYQRENLEQIRFWAPKGYKDKIKAHAAGRGMSMAEYLKKLIDEDMNYEP